MMSAKRHRNLLLAGMALLVLAALAASLTDTGRFLRPAGVPSPGGQSGAAPAPKAIAPRPALPDPQQPGGPVASLLTLTNLEPGGAARILVSLGRPGYHDSTPNGADESIMAHEIVRQAVLDAARGAGALVRDATIGDALPGPTAAAALEVDSSFIVGGSPVAILARPAATAGGREVLATFDLGGRIAKFIDYRTLLERAEALARAPDGFPKVLAAVGLNGARAEPKPGGRPGADIERRLARLTCTEQFAAVRALHAEIHDQGESPDRLGALARGYANLGVLTEFHWSSRHKAFKARALLAAQRLVAGDPRSPQALWHRAYARALVGFHKDALDDLAAAEALATAGPAAAQAPSWLPLIDDLCRFRTSRLTAARSQPDGPLAMLLAFLTVEESYGGQARAVKLGRDLLDDNPECYRVHDALCRLGGVANWHTATLAGMQAMTEALPGRLQALPGLPGPAAALLRGGGFEPEVIKALVDTGPNDRDPGEPSWVSLGRMLRDARFAQVHRRGYFMRYAWSVPADDFVAESWPMIAEHPYSAAVASFRLDPRREADKYTRLLQEVTIPDIEFTEHPFIYAVGMADLARHKHLIDLMIGHGDIIYHDFARMLPHLRVEAMVDAARDMEAACPFAPLPRARLVEHDWAHAEPHAREWEAGAGEHPDVLVALGQRYLRLKRWDDAERCLVRAAALSPPDTTTYQLLAQAYKGRGDLTRWEATLQQSLAGEDAGLGHVQVEVDIANHYMSLKQWDKALPHAEAAAASWASRGLICAAHCREGMGDWEQAELWQRRNTERYPEEAWLGWFYFCKRTGRGDLAAARKFARDYAATFGAAPSDSLRETLGYFHLLDGSLREALAIFRPSYEKKHYPYGGIMVATLADELGDPKERDRVLAELAANPQTKELKLEDLVQVLRDGLSGPGGGRIDSKAVAAALNQVEGSRRCIMAVFAARLLHAHGAPKKASSLVRQCLDSLASVGWAQALAALSLREWEGRSGEGEPKPIK